MERVIVGQAPSRSSFWPLEGRAGARIAELAGLDGWEELTACFALTNLLPAYPGPKLCGTCKGGRAIPYPGCPGLGSRECCGACEWETCPSCKGTGGKGDLFPREEAAAAAERMHRLLGEEEWTHVLLLGWNVAGAMGLPDAPPLRWLAPTTGSPSARAREVLGRQPSRATFYGLHAWLVPEHFQHLVWPDSLWAVLPHPSGVNRWWNDPANVEAARAFLRAAVRDHVAVAAASG